MRPYSDKHRTDGTWLRIFYQEAPSDELVWHRDHNDRTIFVKEGTGWKIQFDNELPKQLQLGKTYDIPKNVYHRIIKGEDTLVIEIKERT